jgi:hypothetical protein
VNRSRPPERPPKLTLEGWANDIQASGPVSAYSSSSGGFVT